MEKQRKSISRAKTRQLLFRAKPADWSSTHKGDFVYGAAVQGSFEQMQGTFFFVPLSGHALGASLVPVADGTIGQFTGFYDTTGKPVFEDDIVVTTWGYNAEVYFDLEEQRFMLRTSKIPKIGMYHIDKVVGNLWDDYNLMIEKE